jgi:hypothetical protein
MERAATEEWETEVRFQKKFPSVLDSNESYWMKKCVPPVDLADD